MDPLSLLSFLRMVCSFGRSVPSIVKEDEELLEFVPDEHHQMVRKAGRRVITCACVGVLMSLVIVPVSAPLVTVWLDGISAEDAFFRGVLLLCGAPMTFFLGVYWGVAVEMLFTPSWYLGTEAGVRWRDLCGATSVTGCRVISFIVVFVGVACYGLLFYLARTMAPFD